MNGEFLLIALTAITIFTSLFVQAIKKLLDDAGKKYSSNILAVITSFVVSIGTCVGYIIYTGISVTPQIVIEIICLCLLSFLTATLGYDKVIQALAQIKKMD